MAAPRVRAREGLACVMLEPTLTALPPSEPRPCDVESGFSALPHSGPQGPHQAGSLSLQEDRRVSPSVLRLYGPTLLGSSPSRIQGNPQDERRRQMRERVRQSSGPSLKFIFARLLYTLNNIFGGSAYCLYTGHLKTLQQLDLQQKQDVTHILFVHKSLSYHLAFRPANILWLAPGVT